MKIKRIKIDLVKINKIFHYKKILLFSLPILFVGATTVTVLYFKQKYHEAKITDMQKANELFESGKKDEAIELLKDRFDVDGSDKTVAKQLAELYFRSQNYDDFSALVSQAKLDDCQTFIMMAFVARSRGESDKAIEYYNSAIKKSPRNISAYVTLAGFYQVLGDEKNALETIKSGLNYITRSSTLYLLAANYALDLGDKSAAKNYASKALEIDKGNQKAKEILSRK